MGIAKSGNGPNDRKKGRPEAGNSTISEVDVDNLDDSLEIKEKYTNELDEVSRNVTQRHPNRNLNKPDIDKPPYS